MKIANILWWVILALLVYIAFLRGYFLRRREFKCLRCNTCCKLLVMLSKEDIERINNRGYKDFLDIKGKHLRRKNGYCIFFNNNNNNNISECSINDIKPQICRKYPNLKGIFGKKYDQRCKNFHKKLF